MLSYTKLWILLESRGMKKTDLKEVISGNTLAKLGKNENVNSEVIEKICAFLKCQPGDIMEYISEDDVKKTLLELDKMNKVMFETLKEQGITQEQFLSLMKEAMPGMIKGLYSGENPMTNLFEITLNEDKNNADNS